MIDSSLSAIGSVNNIRFSKQHLFRFHFLPAEKRRIFLRLLLFSIFVYSVVGLMTQTGGKLVHSARKQWINVFVLNRSQERVNSEPLKCNLFQH